MRSSSRGLFLQKTPLHQITAAQTLLIHGITRCDAVIDRVGRRSDTRNDADTYGTSLTLATFNEVKLK